MANRPGPTAPGPARLASLARHRWIAAAGMTATIAAVGGGGVALALHDSSSGRASNCGLVPCAAALPAAVRSSGTGPASGAGSASAPATGAPTAHRRAVTPPSARRHRGHGGHGGSGTTAGPDVSPAARGQPGPGYRGHDGWPGGWLNRGWLRAGWPSRGWPSRGWPGGR